VLRNKGVIHCPNLADIGDIVLALLAHERGIDVAALGDRGDVADAVLDDVGPVADAVLDDGAKVEVALLRGGGAVLRPHFQNVDIRLVGVGLQGGRDVARAVLPDRRSTEGIIFNDRFHDLPSPFCSTMEGAYAVPRWTTVNRLPVPFCTDQPPVVNASICSTLATLAAGQVSGSVNAKMDRRLGVMIIV